MSSRREYWDDIARFWAQIGPPLRPSEADLGFVRRTVARWSAQFGAPRALILGVTPELALLPWPPQTDLRAVDHTRAMIEAVWPGPRSDAICAEWDDLPLADASRDIALCDGGLHLMDYPRGQQAFVRSMRRVLVGNGLLLLRLFVPPVRAETPQAVIADLLAGHIADTNSLKLRLGMALQSSPEEGLRVHRVWHALHEAAPDFSALAGRLGWPAEQLLAINAYRDSPNRYCFVTLEQVRQMFCVEPGGFELSEPFIPDYDLGVRCPSVVLKRKPESG